MDNKSILSNAEVIVKNGIVYHITWYDESKDNVYYTSVATGNDYKKTGSEILKEYEIFKLVSIHKPVVE